MKKNLLIFAMVCLFGTVWAQENRFSLTGGYVFSNIEETDTEATGWRLNVTYEFNPGDGMFSHGFTFGYLGTTGDFTSATKRSDYKSNSFPVYYAPKISVGKGNLKGFLKGALGTHITGYKRTGTLAEEISTVDMGFYGGVSAGGSLDLGDKLFISAEYEWAYMSNTYYKDGFVNSAMGGIGIKF